MVPLVIVAASIGKPKIWDQAIVEGEARMLVKDPEYLKWCWESRWDEHWLAVLVVKISDSRKAEEG